ncbi:MAG: hypothetical protein JSW42_07965 [Chloroflexota bacterium]|nr:MAG: hypothetical protein JSW42_07965 [Chloroflexota bacterium]
MAGNKPKNPPTKNQRAISAGIAGVIIGAVGGAIIGASFDNVLTGTVIGAIVIGPTAAAFDYLRREGQPTNLVYRILMMTFAGGVIGALVGMLFPGLSLVLIGLVIGLLSGLFGLRVNKVVLGIITGGVLGFLVQTFYPGLNPAVFGALVVFTYRVLSTVLFRNQENIQLMAERVPKEEIKYVVPFEANSNYIGADYFKDLARSEEGQFTRNLEGIGIVESMDNMRGPAFNADLVHPLIRDFYEHTSNYKLNITPEWELRFKPLFWIFKRFIAQPIGQANLPFNTEEAQQGVVSYIDAIDFKCDDIIDLRGWVRAFEQTGEAIYVGIYTTFQHQAVGYVSVGFPLPDSNFTATLLPKNHNESDFLLTSRDTGHQFPGHYLTASENENLTVLKLPTLNEEIEVFVRNEQLRTEHRFYLAGLNFLTLHYTMERMEH